MYSDVYTSDYDLISMYSRSCFVCFTSKKFGDNNLVEAIELLLRLKAFPNSEGDMGPLKVKY